MRLHHAAQARSAPCAPSSKVLASSVHSWDLAVRADLVLSSSLWASSSLELCEGERRGQAAGMAPVKGSAQLAVQP